MHMRSVLCGRFKSDSVSGRLPLIAGAIPASNWRRTVPTSSSWFLSGAIVLCALISAAPWLSAQAPPSLKPNQVATFSFHPSSS